MFQQPLLACQNTFKWKQFKRNRFILFPHKKDFRFKNKAPGKGQTLKNPPARQMENYALNLQVLIKFLANSNKAGNN